LSPDRIIPGGALDRQGPKPIYLQIKDGLKARIAEGKLAPGDRLPSENELARGLNISRMTVRQAIQELVREGIVQVRRGDGTFITHNLSTQMLFKLEGFTAEMTRLGYSTRSQVLSIAEVRNRQVHGDAYDGLNVNGDSSLVRLKRIRFLNDLPFAIETVYLPQELGSDLLSDANAVRESIYAFLESRFDLHVLQVDQCLQPVLARNQTADLLRIETGVPLLRLRGTAYAEAGRPVEYMEGFYRGEPYEFKVILQKEKD